MKPADRSMRMGAVLLLASALWVGDKWGPIHPSRCLADQTRAPDDKPEYTNHLINEKSPYLQQHAHNPVDWYPWGAEAFGKAKKENKPIFLSIGYSTCHWCHVMERESFENQAVAKLINDHFIAIKVDREERPDLDAVYMQFVTAMTGDGGWPMTVFLTPDRKPFFGGTYFPRDSRDGIPGLTTILTKVHEAWTTQHDKVTSSAESLARKLTQMAATARTGRLEPTVLDQTFEIFRGDFDVHHGGFGGAPKFPRPVTLDFLFHYYHHTARQAALEMSLQTLQAMADGGIHDQLGGGFHRYSTDDHWFLPHFEKMLYDQAQLANRYLDAYQITHDARYAATARDILDYVLRDMTGPEGQFFSAEDADSIVDRAHPDNKGEGAFYGWTAPQIQAALGDELGAIFDYRFGVKDAGNVDRDPRGEFKDHNILFVAHSIPETAKQFDKSEAQIAALLDAAREKLLAVRGHRPRPPRDDKTLVSWNGLMISAFARAGPILQEPRYIDAAKKAAEFIRAHLYNQPTHRLTRRWRDGQAEVAGFLDDYAFYVHGLLDLYENDLDVQWLSLALDLQRKQDELFWDPKSGGYFRTAGDDPTLLIRLKEDEDNAEPSGNSIAASNLVRLAEMTDDKALRERAAKTIEAFAADITQSPSAVPQMLAAFEFSLSKPNQVVLAGKADAPDTRAMLTEIYRHYLPDKIILLADGGVGQKFLSERLPFIRGVAMIENRATAYVCRNYACQLPTNNVTKLGQLLDRHQTPATTQP